MDLEGVLRKLGEGKPVHTGKTDNMATIVEFLILHDTSVKIEPDYDDPDNSPAFKITKL